MKLISIRLHPFGGTSNRLVEFADSITVLNGPNEAGKSTLRHALFHALLTPTKLTPAVLKRTLGRWYPAPDGDNARITLVFGADGQTWTLTKVWGAGASSSLSADDGAAIQDPTGVQARLGELLLWNAATWEKVLFTGQAELASTVDRLKKEAGTIDDVRSLLSGPSLLPEDIASEKIREALEAQIARYFKRWDRIASQPEKGRGIDNRWKSGVGEVLTTWYERESVKRVLRDVSEHERAVDAANNEVSRLKAAAEVGKEFVETGRQLRRGLSNRATWEERVSRLRNEDDEMKEVFSEWPAVMTELASAPEREARLRVDLGKLDEELRNARTREGGSHIERIHSRYQEALKTLRNQERELGEHPDVDPDDVDELSKANSLLSEIQIKLEAQKLNAVIQSDSARSIRVTEGAGPASNIDLTAGDDLEVSASGRIMVEVDGLSLSVQSGQLDIEALLLKQGAESTRRDALLEKLGVASEEEARSALSNRETAQGAVDTSERDLKSVLDGKSPEDLEREMGELSDLPLTRDVKTLETERGDLLEESTRLDVTLAGKRTQVEDWTTEYGSQESLVDRMLSLKGKLKETEGHLRDAPALPDGYESVEDYLSQLEEKEGEQEELNDDLVEAGLEKATLSARQFDQTAEELDQEVALLDREFKRRLSDGDAYVRILAKLDELCADEVDDPYASLGAAIVETFNQLTQGRYEDLEFDGAMPTGVITGEASLDSGWLSQGTLGSLALAVRLSLAATYLKELDGFLFLDDPFIDMDPNRRAAAIKKLSKFGTDHQILFSTCHPEHARELEAQGGTIVELS